MSKSSTSSNVGCLGAIIACILSVSLNHSFWWAIFHLFCSWVYILYALLCRSKEIIPALKAMFL